MFLIFSSQSYYSINNLFIGAKDMKTKTGMYEFKKRTDSIKDVGEVWLKNKKVPTFFKQST